MHGCALSANFRVKCTVLSTDIGNTKNIRILERSSGNCMRIPKSAQKHVMMILYTYTHNAWHYYLRGCDRGRKHFNQYLQFYINNE